MGGSFTRSKQPLTPTGGVIVIVGLPGAGKTHLALALGKALLDRGWPALVLHTDLLKVWVRSRSWWLRWRLGGPGYAGEVKAKADRLVPHLNRQAAKARRDGYWLVVEGTLAWTFAPPGALRVLLTLADDQRWGRIATKHPAARRTLEAVGEVGLEAYRRALWGLDCRQWLCLDASAPLDATVARVLAALDAGDSPAFYSR
ncbi:MAG: AAA family ATPase [Candidatus Competibacterales bacterium]